MTGPTVYPTNIQWVGYSPESTYGTPVAAPTMWVPVMEPKWKPDIKQLDDEALRGNMATTQSKVAGVRSDTFDFKTNLYLDTVFPMMRAVAGQADTISGSSDPYTHKTALLNAGNGQPASSTLWLFNGVETWQMPGCQAAQVDVDISAEALATLMTSWIGLPATIVTNPTNTPSTTKPAPSWNTVLKLGGTTVTPYSAFKASYKRETKPIWTADGTQSPYVVFVGPLTVTGEVTAIYQGYGGAPADLAGYIANTQPSLVAALSPAGDATHSHTWQHTVVGYDSVEVSGQAGGWMEADAKWAGLANATDGIGGTVSPFQFLLKNAVSTAY